MYARTRNASKEQSTTGKESVCIEIERDQIEF